MSNNSNKHVSKTKNNTQKKTSEKQKNRDKAKYDDMRQVDWSYFGPSYWD